MDIVIFVAVAENGVIGRDGGMPWKLSSDLKRFKAQTMGRPVIMGRKTYESIGRPLPGRLNIVVTRDRNWRAESVESAGNLDEAIALATIRAEHDGIGEIAVIGGGEIYAQAMAKADLLHVTHVHATPEGDTSFPEIRPEEWAAQDCEDVPSGERDSHATRFCIYQRRRAS